MIDVDILRKLISINLEHIYNAKNQSIHKSGFFNLDKNKLENPDELIGILVKLDLIETESDDDIYFLTEIGYNYAENHSGWYWGELPPEYGTEDKYDDDDEDEEFDPNPIPLVNNHTKGKKYFWLILLVIIVVYYFLIHNPKPRNNELKILPELIKEVKHHADSLEQSKTHDSITSELHPKTIRIAATNAPQFSF